ncbi:MAG: SUMF1/EgtB/PvdO family nonheme iron enzyme, partial [Phycisphaerales bacterium]
MLSKTILRVVAMACILACGVNVGGEVVIETVTVGNPGNASEPSGECVPGGFGPCRECGAVDYVYSIGKFEVTAGQYTEFLNAVAGVDTFGLYNTSISDEWGCKIERFDGSGTVGDPYQYRVASAWADRPVNYVSWGDAARFANWLHNGQPTGAQDLTTTENGSYDLSATHAYYEPGGEIIDLDALNNALLAVVREEDATWVIPSEDEWYKAAYYDGGSGVYYDYPTSTDAVPNNGNPEGDTGNSANFYDAEWTIGSPYYRTVVGFFALSDSPYGSFDQGGNIQEWHEAVIGAYRGLRGGMYSFGVTRLHAAHRDGNSPTTEHDYIGFRVTRVNCNNN